MNLHEHSHTPDDNAVNGTTHFCQKMSSGGGGMSMYMTGFHFSLWQTNAPCLNFLWPTWTLDSQWKFYTAMILTMGLGILVEVLPIWKMKFLRHITERTPAAHDQQHQHSKKEQMQILLLSTIHGIQALLGYILMLVAMTYSVELIMSVLTGISLGFYMCFKVKKRLGSSSSSSHRLQESSEMGMGVLGHCNPCCEFVDDSNHLYSALGIDHEEEEDDDVLLDHDQFHSLHHRTKNHT
jgi:F0F1-type ATP synthase assembly protein I